MAGVLLVSSMIIGCKAPGETSEDRASAGATAVHEQTNDEASGSTGSAAIRDDTAEDGAKKEQDSAEPVYSPFALRLDGMDGFDVISFKSLGLIEPIGGTKGLVLEALAASLRRELEAHADLSVKAAVYHDESLTKPESHRSCEMRHIYVDVWHSSSPERLGYSLWAGCNERSRFAWREIPSDGDNKSIVDQLTPMTRDMADKIATATASDCFQRFC